MLHKNLNQQVDQIRHEQQKRSEFKFTSIIINLEKKPCRVKEQAQKNHSPFLYSIACLFSSVRYESYLCWLIHTMFFFSRRWHNCNLKNGVLWSHVMFDDVIYVANDYVTRKLWMGNVTAFIIFKKTTIV